MKLYNPFKPHIIVNGIGHYYVRKLTIDGWEYLYRRYQWISDEEGYGKAHSWVSSMSKHIAYASKVLAQIDLDAAVEREKQELLKKKQENTWRKV